MQVLCVLQQYTNWQRYLGFSYFDVASALEITKVYLKYCCFPAYYPQ